MPVTKRLIPALPSSAVLLALMATAQAAADSGRGRLLYENHCLTCHESVVHIRGDRKARSLGEITWQIGRWANGLKLDWRYGEVCEVLRYLNERFYQLDKTADCP